MKLLWTRSKNSGILSVFITDDVVLRNPFSVCVLQLSWLQQKPWQSSSSRSVCLKMGNEYPGPISGLLFLYCCEKGFMFFKWEEDQQSAGMSGNDMCVNFSMSMLFWCSASHHVDGAGIITPVFPKQPTPLKKYVSHNPIGPLLWNPAALFNLLMDS